MNAESFIHGFYKSIIDKKVDTILDSYVQSADTYVILEGPRLSTRGFENIAPGWKDFCKSNIVLNNIQWLEGPFIYDMKDNVTLAGVIRLRGSISPGKLFDNTYRASFLLIKIENSFKIMHEHVSGALADPYGIGDWKINT